MGYIKDKRFEPLFPLNVNDLKNKIAKAVKYVISDILLVWEECISGVSVISPIILCGVITVCHHIKFPCALKVIKLICAHNVNSSEYMISGP
jgi:hypothetical protein